MLQSCTRSASLSRHVIILARIGCRRLSNASSTQPADAAEDPGWPLKYKVAGALFLGSAIPWMASYAVSHDPGTRRLAEMFAPGWVQWLRTREGGHFEDEDPKRLEYVARAPEWMDLPVGIEVRTNDGEGRRLLDLDPKTPFASLGRLVQSADRAEGGAWLTEFRVLESGEGVGEGAHRIEGQSLDAGSTSDTASRWGNDTGNSEDSDGSKNLESFSHGGGEFNSDIRPRQPRDVAACNIRSWWDIANLEVEKKKAPPAAPAARSGATSSTTRQSVGLGSSASYTQKMTQEQAKASVYAIEETIQSLEQDMRSGVRSVDDVDAEVRELRKQQKELRRNHLKKTRRFLGLF